MSSNESQTNDSNDLMTNTTKVETSEEVVNSRPLQTPIIHNISPRTISGVLTQTNQNAIDWSSNGLIAFGSHNRVIIANTRKCVKHCQSLHRHNSPVCLIRWCNSTDLKLCSVDTNGTIIVWDVSEASILALIPGSKETKSIQSLEWIEYSNSIENSVQNYILVLYRNYNNLILYDTEFGEIVWNKHFDRNIKSISLDPFCKNNMLFGINSNECCFGIIDDLRANKCPNRDSKEYKINIKGSTAMPNSPKSSGPLLKYNLVVKTVNNETQDSNDLDILNEYIQVSYHRSVRNQMFVVFSREILLIDLSIEAIICSIPLERSCSNIMSVYSCHNRNAFYVCHEFGTVSFRLFQKQMITDSNEGTSCLNISYINLCQSDGLRLTKQNKIFGYSISKLDETKVALLLNNGRLIIKTVYKRDEKFSEEELRVPYISDLISIKHYQMNETKSKTYRILMTHLLPALSYNPNVIRMCPAVTLRNWPIHKPLLAVGDSSGTIQIWNLSLTILEREFSIHSFPVRGIEWTGLSTFISFAYPTVSPNSGKTNNELNITDVTSGRTLPLRAERNMDSSPIELLRISHLKQYLIILLKDDPFEIWDLKTLSLLRVMPKQFAAITAVEWSPLYNKRIERVNSNDKSNINDSVGHQLPSKENFVVTNKNGELYHFSIEGNIVKEITCIPPDTEMNVNITCIAWKSDQVLLGDAVGNINVWDLKKKISRAEPTHRGSIKKLRFGPGRGNMKFLILYNDGVDIWDVKELKLNAQLKYPRDINFKINDIDWAGSDRPILVTSEGTILISDMKLKQYTSPISDLVFNEIDNENINLYSVNFHLLSQMSQFIFKSKFILNQLEDGPKLPDCDIERNILVAKLFHDFDAYNFWNIVSYVITNNKERLDLNNDLYLDNNYFKDIETEKVTLLQSIRNKYNQSKICYELLLLLNQPHRAVQLLLETDPHSMDEYYVDALKACLIASLQSRSEDSTAYPVVKLVATNLIANGMIDEGSQLLCLIGKAQDACRYLQSGNKWLDAVWLAKCTLNTEEYNEIMRRWGEHLISQNDLKTALLVFLSFKQFSKVIQTLSKFDVEKAVLFASVCIKRELINIDDNQVILEEIFDNYSKILENSGLDQAIGYYRQLLTKQL